MTDHVLFITCSSGNGHMVATHNIQSGILAEHPDTTVHVLDIINYLYPLKPIIVDLWNAGIRQDSFLTHYLSRTIGFYEFFYHHFFGKKLANDLKKLFKSYPIETVIDTQPVFTPFLISQTASAATTPITYHKVLTDLPVNAHHPFFTGIKKRNRFKNLSFFLHSTPPLINANDNEAQFWQAHCNIDHEHIKTTWGKPVHPAFKKTPQDHNTVDVKLDLHLATHYHFPLTSQLIIPENAYVTTIMMGSQGLEAIENYFDKIVETFSHAVLEKPHYFFIACSRNESLFSNLLQKCLQLPRNNHLKMIPLEMQAPENVASLMWRSQTILLRASGLSCMEQLAMNETAALAGIDFKPKRFIHSHCKRTIPKQLNHIEQQAFLLSHSVGHEKGNALYLQKKLGAIITRPDLWEL